MTASRPTVSLANEPAEQRAAENGADCCETDCRGHPSRTEFGSEARDAATAIDAQRLVIEQNPELALVDLNLEGELAIDFINWLHRRGLRVIVMSGLAVLPPKVASQAAAFLQKPFGAEELFATMHQVMVATM